MTCAAFTTAVLTVAVVNSSFRAVSLTGATVMTLREYRWRCDHRCQQANSQISH